MEIENGDALKDTVIQTTQEDMSSNTTMSDFKLTVAAATAAAQKTAAALMAAHASANIGQNVQNPNCNKDNGVGCKPSIVSNGRSTFVIPKNKLFGALVPINHNCPSKTTSNVLNKEEDVEKKPIKKSKWGPDPRDDPIVKRGLALALQTRAEQIAAQLDSGFLDIETTDAPRSPSPPPIYDSNGQRTNTREGRRREQLEIERREAIGECMRLNPLYKPPAGFKPVYKEAKLFIPVKNYPGYNFIGLILGPRGNTQKRMEQETGTKIAIRGRGAVKEGKRPVQTGRRDKDLEAFHDDLHVHITADCIEKVDAAVALIEPLLTPVDEVQNMHKRKQLRELAEMNGTMRDFPKICSICGEVGHHDWQCSKEALITFQSKVVCTICGNGGHPSIDCPQKNLKSGSTQGQTLDTEYMKFLKELNNGSLGVVSNASSSAMATNTTSSGIGFNNT
ncbi:hypothetical protein M758_12G097700 [Ceratodon purpureus]|uniref:CCHC-type domain-containing protein n=1 Tax=Ceratodon purpureus TaxID=3225 RepID=A0A8T0G7L2_CERPU|nr:hypothetical protein KC19_12G094200 [Ceratodon purpureus]KAG0598747.1 hypothetical protein M758_12G097700 [Ceratodon purpureus]